MTDELKDFSFWEHIARVLSALGATAAVALVSIFAVHWLLGT